MSVIENALANGDTRGSGYVIAKALLSLFTSRLLIVVRSITRPIAENDFHQMAFEHLDTKRWVSSFATASFVGAIALMLGAFPTSAAAQVKVLDPIKLPAGFLYPNGIAQAPDGGILVGSIVSGHIVKINDDVAKRFGNSDPSVFAGTALKFGVKAKRLWGSSPDFLGVEKLCVGCFQQDRANVSPELHKIEQPGSTREQRVHRIFARDADTGALDIVMLIPDGGFANDIALGSDGSLFITDTSVPRILTLPAGENRLKVLVKDKRLSSSGEGLNGVGAAGIAIASDGRTLLVGIFGSGAIFAIKHNQTNGAELRRLKLQRPLENPDGFTIDQNGNLLLVEGGVTTGNGKLTRIINPLAKGVRPVETLVENLDVPVNLLIDANDPSLVYVTESGLGHLFTNSGAQPKFFHVRRYHLN